MVKLTDNDEAELEGVHLHLADTVVMAAKYTRVDFSVFDGLRSEAEQAQYVEARVSWTMKSMHLKQTDGYGHAVDLVPRVNGKLRWEWVPIYEVARAMRKAANELGVQLIWGGCWQVITGTSADPEELMKQYVTKCLRQGKKVRADGAHFELRVK